MKKAGTLPAKHETGYLIDDYQSETERGDLDDDELYLRNMSLDMSDPGSSPGNV